MAKAAAKRLTFNWEGTNKKGQSVKGEMMSVSADFVKAELRRQGIKPTNGKIKKKGKVL